MELPVAISINHRTYSRPIVNQWLTENMAVDSVVRATYGSMYIFETGEDATAFALRFGGVRMYTKAEQIIRELDEADTD